MERQATDLFQQGYSCAQAIVLAYSPFFDISDTCALGVTQAFGGGLKRQDVCGAVTGAYMVLGLYARTQTDNPQATNELVKSLMVEYNSLFLDKFESFSCREITGVDFDKLKRNNQRALLKKSHDNCIRVVEISSEILKNLMNIST